MNNLKILLKIFINYPIFQKYSNYDFTVCFIYIYIFMKELYNIFKKFEKKKNILRIKYINFLIF